MMDNRAENICKRFDQLKADRGNWESHWDEVAKFVIPKKDNVYGQATPGEKRANRLFDSEAIRANDDLSAAFHGMLTSPSETWFGLGTGIKKTDKIPAVIEWFDDSVHKMIQTLNNSNFQVEIFETYQDLGSIGTTLLRMEEDDKEVIRFHSEPVYGVQIEEDNKKQVDTVYRIYEMTKRQIILEFGEKVITEELERQMGDDVNKKFEILHEIRPRLKSEIGRKKGSKAMPYASTHVLKAMKHVLKESGFHEFPCAVPRWTKTNGEKFGRSPAMKVLSDIKMINSMKKVTIQGGQLRIAPPLQGPDNGFLTPPNFKPFGMNYKRQGLKDKIEPLFTAGDPGFGLDFIQVIKESIRDGYHTDKLKMVTADRMTATEVMQRRDEQLRFLGPILGRLDRELLKPIIDRLFGIMLRRGKFEEMPKELKELEGAQINIRYMSSIAKAQMSGQSDDIVRAISDTAIIAEAKPEVWDNIDADAFLRKNWEVRSADPDLLIDPKKVKEMREQRAQAQQQQMQQEQQLQAMETASKMERSNAGESP